MSNNIEKTKASIIIETFVAFDVHDFSSSLDVLVQSLDTCLQEYNLPTYYAVNIHLIYKIIRNLENFSLFRTHPIMSALAGALAIEKPKSSK